MKKNLCLSKKAFSLVEMLVVLSILAIIATTVGGVYINIQKQKAYEITLQVMEEVKKAILGSYYPKIRGVNISGYVADMGNLPELYDENGKKDPNGQPKALWTNDLDNDGKPDFPLWKYYEDKRIWAGWNGPYIGRPGCKHDKFCSIIDGWGRLLRFIKGPNEDHHLKDGDMKIISYGADGRPGGSGLDEDIEMVIKKEHYMAPVGFHVERFRGSLTIYYPENGELTEMIVNVDDNGNFMSDKNQLIPIGLRSIDSPSGGKPIVFSVEPTMNWLGTLE